MKRSAQLLSLIMCAASLSACKKEAPPTVEKPSAPEVSVTTAEVQTVMAPKRLRLTGTLRGTKETELAANVAGLVLSTKVERGQRVKAGDIIAQIDVQSARLALAEARVAVETQKTQQEINQADCARYEKLKKSGAVTALEYDQVTAKCRTAPLNVEAAEARQRIAAKNVGDGLIRAPFSGLISERYIEQGEYVQPSSRVVALAEVEALRLLFSVPERNFPDVKLDAEVELRVAAYPEEVFVGHVSHISGAVRDTRDVVVEALVDNKDGQLLPGMFVDLELITGQEELPAVPRSATFEENGKTNVLLVNDHVLEQRVIFAERAVDENIPVRRGLTLGQLVVAPYEASLKNGQRVK
jgi:RND family efflux transporter MFP subunit